MPQPQVQPGWVISVDNNNNNSAGRHGRQAYHPPQTVKTRYPDHRRRRPLRKPCNRLGANSPGYRRNSATVQVLLMSSVPDFGNFQQTSIAGKTYSDLAGNGFTPDDTVLNGITVNLYKDTNANGTLEVGTDTVVGTPQTTAGAGDYLFSDIGPGQLPDTSHSPSQLQYFFPRCPNFPYRPKRYCCHRPKLRRFPKHHRQRHQIHRPHRQRLLC